MPRKMTQPSTKSVIETHRNSDIFLFPWKRQRRTESNKMCLSKMVTSYQITQAGLLLGLISMAKGERFDPKSHLMF